MLWLNKRRHISVALLAVLILLSAVFVFVKAQQQPLLQTEMTQLLPEDAQLTAAQQAAQRQIERQMNQQLLLLVGASDKAKAQTGAAELANLWRRSAIFTEVADQHIPDMAQWRQQALVLQLALLPSSQQQLLESRPQQYFAERATDIANPFSPPSLLPLDEDWAGFGRFILPKTQPANSRLQWDADSGVLHTEYQGKYWIAITGRLPENTGAVSVPNGLLDLVRQTETQAAVIGVETRLAGGAVFAAEAKHRAETEGARMGIIGTLLTLLLLLLLFRRARVLWVFMPVAVGLGLGFAACVLVFGQIHVLTLVIGTSLVGVLLDFPLHWLAPALLSEKWQAKIAMNRLLPAFVLACLITALGYVLLLFAPLPILRQCAVFSIAALIGALWASVCGLPPLFHRCILPAQTWLNAWFGRLWQTIHGLRCSRRRIILFWGAWLVLVLAGCWHSRWQDDIRTWANLSPKWLQQAQAVSEISGITPSAQFLLIEADDEESLLKADAAVVQRLSGSLKNTVSLSQWVQPIASQQQLKNTLHALADQPETWTAMTDLGIPENTIRQALLTAAQAPDIDLHTALNTPLAQAWQPLFLGEVSTGRYAALVRLTEKYDAAEVRELIRNMPNVSWVDKVARLNESFTQTRNQTLWLKIISLGLAWISLVWYLGFGCGSRVLAVPVLTALSVIALLGWLNLPIGLFVIFGLLLVSAIGIDYAVYLHTADINNRDERLAGSLLAAITSLISFGLLAFSSTPVVAQLGLTVALGVVLSLGFSIILMSVKQSD
ncbi:MMPL family transporter [Stenoxybacter acetivorans]|uniref:MMPL family transporter n=1 Tax=Stenoxybacter acetivorans TaxID=422441 RepID=UPI00068A0F14|nr:hypothetical protein [Stenoxybacter acetivorans]